MTIPVRAHKVTATLAPARRHVVPPSAFGKHCIRCGAPVGEDNLYCAACREEILRGPRLARPSRSAAPASPCPDHPAAALVPFPGGGARGSCPVDGRSYQMTPVEVTW